MLAVGNLSLWFPDVDHELANLRWRHAVDPGGVVQAYSEDQLELFCMLVNGRKQNLLTGEPLVDGTANAVVGGAVVIV